MNSPAEIMVAKDPLKRETILTMRIKDELVLDRMGENIMVYAVKQMVDKYVEVHFEEISAKVDTEALAKQLALAVTAALAEKAIQDGLEASKSAASELRPVEAQKGGQNG